MSTAGTITGAAAEPLKDPEWSLQFGSTLPPVQIASPYEKHVVRSLSNPNGEFRTSHARTPHHLLGGTITPNGLHFSIDHSGVPNIDPAKHKLVIHGMVRQLLEFALETLSRYLLVTRINFLECAGNSAPMFSKEPLQVTAQASEGSSAVVSGFATLDDQALSNTMAIGINDAGIIVGHAVTSCGFLPAASGGGPVPVASWSGAGST